MSEHHLKTISPYYEAVATGAKTFEIRKNDRAFQAGDIIHLHFFDPALCHHKHRNEETARKSCPAYLGSSRTFEVSYVYAGDPRFGGIEPGYVVLGLRGEDA